jgi:hypothetical protein
MLGADGSHLLFKLLRRQRSRGLRYKAQANSLHPNEGWQSGSSGKAPA